ncbi:sialate O-acetylesterase [Azohydromonas australica]|uniref:sialate O-acetylesterase n=1 Tax=Azohydromonas australica TaxID=364039 RepID=UPI0004908786|nr:sialate O-acetylesterase [Azohydromonas australica]
MRSRRFKAVSIAAAVLLAGLLLLLAGMRSALQQDALFRRVMAVWSHLSPGDAKGPVQFNRYNQLVAYPGKVEIPRPEITGRTLVVFGLGQSNAANSGGERHEAVDDRVLNYWNGKTYRAVDPLLGASGQSGSVWVALANRLVARQMADRVILLAAGIGGTSVQEWRRGGRLHAMLEERLLDARRNGLFVTHFLWHQGEQDHPAVSRSRLDMDQYKEGVAEVIELTKLYFPESRFFVAQASRCSQTPPSTELTQAQAALARREGVYLGPNTDDIGPMDRYDGCHLSGRGLEKHAAAWVDALAHPAKEMPGSSVVKPNP